MDQLSYVDALHARPIETEPLRDEAPDTYEKGRRCPEDGCVTTLNRYNPGPYCLLHAQRHEGRLLDALAIFS